MAASGLPQCKSLSSLLLLLLLFPLFHLSHASSQARSSLRRISEVTQPVIRTPEGLITAYSHFDITFAVYGRPVKLVLEPHHGIIAPQAVVNYIGADGEVTRSEPIQRMDHKVFTGTSYTQMVDGSWEQEGWARITVKRDGSKPLFDGTFVMDGEDHVHVQTTQAYKVTRVAGDPVLAWEGEEAEADRLIVWRDSDTGEDEDDVDGARNELRKRDGGSKCLTDSLAFNQPARMFRKDDVSWAGFHVDKRQRQSGDLRATIGQTAGCPSTRRVALVGVVADCEYVKTFPSPQAARDNIIQQFNSASKIYERTFNITLGVQNLTISEVPTSGCPSTPPSNAPWNIPCSSNVGMDRRLATFSTWRNGINDNNAFWTLLSACPDQSAVGVAWLGQLCVRGRTGRAASAVGVNVVVRTSTEWQVIAHEVGHTFGAVHDCTEGACNDGQSVSTGQCCPLSTGTCAATGRFMMNPTSSRSLTDFSPCSIGNICSAMQRGTTNTRCLTNNEDVPIITPQQCGNGVVEQGEECDCGGPEGCAATNNRCCNPTTCRFNAGAVCDDATGGCCRGCQFAAANTVCRASQGECDPEERCAGGRADCPGDVTLPNGRDCGASGQGLKCASGKCTSRDLQCRAVAGDSTTMTSNSTVACGGDGECTLFCSSSTVQNGACRPFDQNFADGTPCSGGGFCDMGRCQTSRNNPGGGIEDIGNWIQNNRTLVIGLGAGLGGLLLLMIFCCCVSSCRRRSRNRNRPPLPQPPNMMSHPRQQQQQQYNQQQMGYYGPSQAAPMFNPGTTAPAPAAPAPQGQNPAASRSGLLSRRSGHPASPMPVAAPPVRRESVRYM